MSKYIKRLQTISIRMRKFCTLLMWGIPISLILIWSNYETATELGFLHRVAYPMEAPTMTALIVGFLASSLLGALVVGGIYYLRRFFILSSEGELFSREGADMFHRFTKYIVLYAFLSIPFETLLGVIMTWNNPVGERLIGISFQPYDLSMIFLSLVLISISWVLKESVLIAEDNAQII